MSSEASTVDPGSIARAAKPDDGCEADAVAGVELAVTSASLMYERTMTAVPASAQPFLTPAILPVRSGNVLEVLRGRAGAPSNVPGAAALSPAVCGLCRDLLVSTQPDGRHVSKKGPMAHATLLATPYNPGAGRLACFDDPELAVRGVAHVYHASCLDKWLCDAAQQQNPLACPCCRGTGQALPVAPVVPGTSRLGVDVGGVIITKSTRDPDEDTSFFSDNFLSTPERQGAFQALEKLVETFGPENVFIVSKAGQEIAGKTQQWFRHHQFYQRTGMLQQNVYFCPRRRDKLPIARRLGLTHFIDDKLDVLDYVHAAPSMQSSFWLYCDDDPSLLPTHAAFHPVRFVNPSYQFVRTWAQISDLVAGAVEAGE